MKVVVHDYSGHPFQVQLSRELARRGHDVTHLYADFFQTPHGALQSMPGDANGFQVTSLDLGKPFEKHRFIKRRQQEKDYGRLCARKIIEIRPDIVISSNAPLDAQREILASCKSASIPFVYWLQDLYGVAIRRILAKKWPLLGDAIGAYYESIERRLLRKSNAVVAITEDFRQQLDRWYIGYERISVILNWAPIGEIPLHPKDNPWARQHELAGSFNFVYTGTLGMKHNPELLVALAESFLSHGDVKIVVLSEGPGADHVRRVAGEKGLDNLLVLGFQPFEIYPEVLGSADVLIAVLEKDAGVFSVPSKVLSYLCAQKPLLLAVPLENLAARIVQENDAGIVVGPADAQGFLNAAERLFTDEKLRLRMGAQGRSYAEKHFDIQVIADRFEAILNQFVP